MFNIKEITGDLFDYKDDYILAHCIASDFGMLGGIAKQFVDKMDMRKKLERWAINNQVTTQETLYSFSGISRPQLIGTAVLVDNVFNLVTKTSTSGQPSYMSLYYALLDMKKQVKRLGIKKLAMPRIGCGIDGLSWIAVYCMIIAVFHRTDLEILVVSLPHESLLDGVEKPYDELE